MPDAAPERRFYHGTSRAGLEAILAGGRVEPVHVEANPSLGGAYVTTRRAIAEVCARNAARAHGSTPVVLTVRATQPLLPDEDWVVNASERPLDADFDRRRDQWKAPRLRSFFDDLFSEYLGEGHSLSDAYCARYAELNGRHRITADESLRYLGSARQAAPLKASQVLAAVDLEDKGMEP